MKYMVLAILIIFLQSCTSQSAIIKNSAHIVPGMTGVEILQLMGEPQNRQFKDKNEVWQYCSTDYSGFQADHYILVWLFEGVVTGMQSYRNTQFGPCERFFRIIHWEDVPDASIEIRQDESN